MRITELMKGEKARLIGFGLTNSTFRRRLLSLGLTRGVEIAIVRLAPLGCPVQVEVRGTSLTLRKEEVCYLEWERV